MILVSVIIMILISVIAQVLQPILHDWFGFSIVHNLWNRKETYLVIFTLISVGIVGAIDDYLNIK